MEVAMIIFKEEPEDAIKQWLSENPKAIIKFILGDIAFGKIVVIYSYE